MEAVFGLLFLCFVVFALGLAYKKRSRIARWLNDPDIAASADPEIKRLDMEYRLKVMERKLELLDELDDMESKDNGK